MDQRQVNHRAQWERKKAVRLLYRDFHRQLLRNCPEGRILDIGSGTARVERIVPRVRVRRAEGHRLLAYPMSGGFQKWPLLPAGLVRPILAFEERMPHSFRKHVAFRMTVVLERL